MSASAESVASGMSDWNRARKKPVEVEYRVPDGREQVRTREGTVYAVEGEDYVVRGVEGEIYPIAIEVFEQTYEAIE